MIEAKEVIEDASHGGQVAHGERMEKGGDAATEKVEDEDKDTTIVLSDEEMEQFVTETKKKRKKQEEEKKIYHPSSEYCDLMEQTKITRTGRFLYYKCRICNMYYDRSMQHQFSVVPW